MYEVDPAGCALNYTQTEQRRAHPPPPPTVRQQHVSTNDRESDSEGLGRGLRVSIANKHEVKPTCWSTDHTGKGHWRGKEMTTNKAKALSQPSLLLQPLTVIIVQRLSKQAEHKPRQNETNVYSVPILPAKKSKENKVSENCLFETNTGDPWTIRGWSTDPLCGQHIWTSPTIKNKSRTDALKCKVNKAKKRN